MMRIGHLLDETTGWAQRVGLSTVMERLAADRFEQRSASIGASVRCLRAVVPSMIDALPAIPRLPGLSTVSVARYAARHDLDVIVAWGLRAARAAGSLTNAALVVQLFDPACASRFARLLRTIARPARFAVVCSTGIVQRRLIEGGLPPELAVVIRPGVDFGLINRVRRGPLRRALGLAPDDHVVIVPEPVTRAGCHFDAFCAVAHRRHARRDLRIIVPGDSHEARRIARFAARLPQRDVLIAPGSAVPFEQLVSVSNALLITPPADYPTTSIGWAMAAGAVVIGSAVPAVAEMIAHKVNGLLFNPGAGRNMVGTIAPLLGDRALHAKLAETARGQAYEVFGLRRYADQLARLFDNVCAGVAPAEGIVDPAVAV